MNWRVALKLGRISNLPTVWTNTLAGVVLAGGATGDARVPWLMLALSLCYVAGMFLNDAFDREFDARHRPERPIPSGEVTASHRFRRRLRHARGRRRPAGVGGLRVSGRHRLAPALAGLALGATIVFYDWHHKENPLSPVVMGLCRMLVYVTAAYAFAVDPPRRVFVMAFLLLCYLIGLTYIAKQEHLERVANLWPLAFLAAAPALGTAGVADGRHRRRRWAAVPAVGAVLARRFCAGGGPATCPGRWAVSWRESACGMRW